MTPDPEAIVAPLAELIDGSTLRAFQEGASTITGLTTSICDHKGRPVIGPSGPLEALEILQSSATGQRRVRKIYRDLTATPNAEHQQQLVFRAAAIRAGEQCLGSIIAGPLPTPNLDSVALPQLARDFDLDDERLGRLTSALHMPATVDQQTATQLLHLLADIIAKMAVQSDSLHHREMELGTVHMLSRLLSGTQDLQVVLDTVARKVCEVVQVKATSIRLLDENTNELKIKSVCNLSDDYLNKGPVLLDENPIDRAAFAGEAVYIEDAATDPRTRFPEQAKAEGIVSGLSVGMTYRGRTIGVMRVYTDRKHAFTTAETALLRSIASQATSVIINSQLYIEAAQAERYQQQLKHAGEIQRRMIPDRPPAHPKIAFAHVYEPSSEVGGDFFDFYALPESHEIGLCIADVVGKGIPAALMMASLRTAFRLYAHSVVEITEIMTMINIHMTRETSISEFATMFYGAFAENGRRLSYCCAGHDPPLHWRAGRIRQLATGDFVIGIDPNESFSKKNLPLKKDDVIVFYTDGIVDASNFAGDNFGRERLSGALAKYAEGSADQIAQNIIWDVRRFVGLADQADDITLVVAKVQ